MGDYGQLKAKAKAAKAAKEAAAAADGNPSDAEIAIAMTGEEMQGAGHLAGAAAGDMPPIGA